VFLEDAVSIAGDVIAFAALALNQVTGSSVPQGVAAVLIALVMIRVSLRLIQRSHDFLVGAWAGDRRAMTLLASPSRCGQLRRSEYEPFSSGTPG
jgi:hypothetical protein